tara:strand:+ start:693 stop:1124 length:432 start_codon:yes stop_codon:yes gene_type:complete
MTKVYYKGNEVLDVTTYDQIDRYTVEIDIDVLLKNGDMRTISIKNPLGRKKWDKGYVARRIGIETGICECQETIEGYFNEEYIFEDFDAVVFLMEEGLIFEKETKDILLEVLQDCTKGFSQDSVQRKNILLALKKAYQLGTKK